MVMYRKESQTGHCTASTVERRLCFTEKENKLIEVRSALDVHQIPVAKTKEYV